MAYRMRHCQQSAGLPTHSGYIYMHVWITIIIHRMHALQIMDVRLYIHMQVPWYVSFGYTQLRHS